MAGRLYDQLYRQAQVHLAKILQNEERSIIKLYGTALFDIRKILENLYNKYSKDGVLTNAEMSKYNRLINVQDQICGILREKLKDVDLLTGRLTKEQYEESFFRHAYAIDQAEGMSLNWGLIPEDTVEAVMQSPFSKLASSKAMRLSREGTVDRVRQEIALAVIRGDRYEVLANRISAVLGVSPSKNGAAYNGKGAAYRSMLVARTEGQRVLIEGQQAATKKALELGCDIETIWDATLDGRTRAAHGALDGRPKDDTEKGWFVPEIGYVPAPLHSGVASFDINCRCRMRDQVKGFPPKERYVRGDGIRPYQTYEQWKGGVKNYGSSKGAYSDKTDPNFQKREKHAKLYYEEVRNSDRYKYAKNISENSGISEVEVLNAVNHVFFNKHNIGGEYVLFDESYEMSVCFQRLSVGKNIKKADIIMLKHEIMEYDLMENKGMGYNEAHIEASRRYNFQDVVKRWQAGEKID